MMPEPRLTNRAALAFLSAKLGRQRLTQLAALALVVSLTEGVGLILLVPIAQSFSGAAGSQLPQWLGFAEGVSFPLLLAALVGLVSVRAGLAYLANEQRRGAGLQLAREFRQSTHHAIMAAEWRWLARQNSADQAALIIGESERSASLLNDALSMATNAAILLALGLAAAIISPVLMLALLVLGAPLAILAVLLRANRAVEAEAYWTAYSRLQRLLSAGLEHLRAARIAGAQQELSREVGRASAELAELERIYFRSGHRAQMLFQILAAVFLSLSVYIGLERLQVPLALLLPVVVIAVRAVPVAGALHQSLRSWRFNRPALERLLAHFHEASRNAEKKPDQPASLAFARSIKLDRIGLTYTGRDHLVFQDFSLSIEAGSILGISGASGSGKSSLADLLAGLLIPDSGNLAIDERPLVPEMRHAWRSMVGYVEQDPFFLDATIAENLVWGRGSVSEQDLWGALRQASADFVEFLPQQLATPIGESGRQLSGGELQRLALARALLSQPKLLILDEFTAALDAHNRDALLATIKLLRNETTVVLLSHDPAVLAHANQVIDLDKQQ